jgi:glycosyltransferase involved in cell wall biosynthesis
MSSSSEFTTSYDETLLVPTPALSRVLVLAPQPYFQERGTPLAVRALVEGLHELVLAEEVVLITYPVGEKYNHSASILHLRSYLPSFLTPWVKSICAGPSCRKLVADFFFFFSIFFFLVRAGFQRKLPTVIHSVEESVFMAWIFKMLFRIPYVYDMDSHLSAQVTERWPRAKGLSWLMEFFERTAIKGAKLVIAVCPSLCATASSLGARSVSLVRDFSLLDEHGERQGDEREDLQETLHVSKEALLCLYSGNLEEYQGVELLIDAIAEVTLSHPHLAVHLVVIGGNDIKIRELTWRAKERKVPHLVSLIGPRPVALLRSYLTQADILASPRLIGQNTPMKLYSYLHAGKALLATDIESHNQVVDETTALLVPPTVPGIADGLVRLASNPSLRAHLGNNAYQLAERCFKKAAYLQSLRAAYSSLHSA